MALFDWTSGVGRSTFDPPMAETSTAVIASANNLSVKYGTQVVLDGATIAFTEGEHIGLVGRNGSGQSTFLQSSAGGGRTGLRGVPTPPPAVPPSMRTH